jgi:PAS domain S-box-containing protein
MLLLLFKSRRFILAAIAILSFFALGWVATNQLVAMRDKQERSHLVLMAQMAAAGYRSTDLLALRHTAEDTDTPTLLAVRRQLQQIRQANPRTRYVYLLGQQGQHRIVFYADAENTRSENYSPPGQVYTEATLETYQAFNTGRAFVEGPYRDRWGVWVTGYAPIFGPHQQVVALLGMDIDVKDWQRTLNAYRYFGIGLTLMASLLLLLAVVSAERTDSVNAVLKREITTRARIVDALRESEERYRSLIELTPDIIYRLNEDGTIAFISAAVAQLGYDPDELVGMPFDTLVHPEDRDKAYNHFVEYRIGDRRMKNLEVRLLAKGTPRRAQDAHVQRVMDFEMHYRTIALHARGQWDVPDAEIERKDKHFISTQGIARDVSERRRADTQLRKLSHAIEVSPAVVVITDREGSIEYVNPAFTTVTGYASEDVLGQNPRILASGVHPPEYYAEMWRTILAGDVWHGEICNKMQSGALIWESVAIAPVPGDEGEITHFVAIKVDISARKQVEEELRVAKEAAESANRAKSSFLANMSHEIRTPMNAILGFSQLMRRDPQLTPTQQQHLDTITRSGEHLLALINDILEMSKIEAGRVTFNPSTFDLHALIDDMAMMFRVRTDAKRLRLAVERDADVPRYVVSDENKLRQVLINLIGNAVKFTDHGGVTVHVHALSRDAGLGLRIEVADTGPGIPEPELAKLFRPFVQTSVGAHKEGGTGLGLVISREFARLLGGDITITSRVGEGSVFTVAISVEPGAADTVTTRGETRRVLGMQPGQPTLCILVADDREENRVLLCEMLHAVGFETRQAVNGEEAVEVYETWEPDLVLMDLRMPVMDGYEAIRELRSRHGDTVPIIAVTASTLSVSREEILRCGADDMLSKPFREAELFEKLHAHLDVAYVYEEETPAAEAAPAEEAALSLVACPAELAALLREAALDADRDRLLELVDRLEADDPAAAQGLRALAQRFDYDGILQLCDADGGV